MRTKTYMVNFTIGNVVCRLTTLTREFIPEYHSRYYNHRHAFFEIHYVTKGRFLCKVENQEYEISDGQILLIQPGCDHAVLPLTEEKSKMCLGFDIFRNHSANLQEEEQEFIELFYREKAIVLNVNSDISNGLTVNVLNLIRSMYDMENKTVITIEELKCLVSLLLLSLSKELRLCSTVHDDSASEDRENRIYWIDEFINLNFNRNDGYERLANQLNISTRQLDRLIKQNYGVGYQKMLLEHRLGIAIKLLCETEKPIEEISEIVGYSSTSSFTAFIKRETKHTPSEIRKRAKG